MTYAVTVETAVPRTLAAVHRPARFGEIGAVAMPALDQVYTFLGSHSELRKADGHNVFLYRHAAQRGDPMEIDFGVDVASRFADEGDIVCVDTPAGQVARTLYVGPYNQMRAAHEAVHAWCRDNGRLIGAMSWEVYGDWNADESKLETEIFYLLA